MPVPERSQGWRNWHRCCSQVGNANSACGVGVHGQSPFCDGGCQAELLPMGRGWFPSGKSQQRVINRGAGQLCVCRAAMRVQLMVNVPRSLPWPFWASLVLLRGCATGTGMALASPGHHSCFWPGYMFVHANLTVAFQVQISRENKRESQNRSAGCLELSCSCNISPDPASRACRGAPSTFLFVLCHLFLAGREEAQLPRGNTHPQQTLLLG